MCLLNKTHVFRLGFVNIFIFRFFYFITGAAAAVFVGSMTAEHNSGIFIVSRSSFFFFASFQFELRRICVQ